MTGHPHARRRRSVAGIGGLLLFASACGSFPGEGAALEQASRAEVADRRAFPPGQAWVLMVASIHNIAEVPLTIADVELEGTGIGSTVSVERIMIAPLSDPRHMTPGGTWFSLPPTTVIRGECRTQRVVRMEGFELGPDEEARIVVVLRAARPGPFLITDHVVTYLIDGEPLRQDVPIGMRGNVREGARRHEPSRSDARCIRRLDLDGLPPGG